jgi:hypothetical protein
MQAGDGMPSTICFVLWKLSDRFGTSKLWRKNSGTLTMVSQREEMQTLHSSKHNFKYHDNLNTLPKPCSQNHQFMNFYKESGKLW